MRTEKELWEVVLSRPDLFETGLCFWVDSLHVRDLIKSDERSLLKRVMNSHLPYREYSLYSWEMFVIQPRIDWINKRIKKL